MIKSGDRVFWNDPGGRVVHTVNRIQNTEFGPQVFMRCGDNYPLSQVAMADDNTWMKEHPRCQ